MKKTPSFLIVADRGHLVAYSYDPPNRGSVPQAIESVDFVEGHQRLSEQLTDKAGAFPVAGTGVHATAAAERMRLVAELESRTLRRVAGSITSLLEQHRPATWGFAAPREINGAILDELDPSLRKRLAQNLQSDLINVSASEVLEHFARANGTSPRGR